MTQSFDELPDELLSGYLDGELTAAERQQVEVALQNDPAARARLAELESLRDQLRMLPRLAAPSDLRRRIAEEIAAVAGQPGGADGSLSGAMAASPDPSTVAESAVNRPASAEPLLGSTSYARRWMGLTSLATVAAGLLLAILVGNFYQPGERSVALQQPATTQPTDSDEPLNQLEQRGDVEQLGASDRAAKSVGSAAAPAVVSEVERRFNVELLRDKSGADADNFRMSGAYDSRDNHRLSYEPAAPGDLPVNAPAVPGPVSAAGADGLGAGPPASAAAERGAWEVRGEPRSRGRGEDAIEFFTEQNGAEVRQDGSEQTDAADRSTRPPDVTLKQRNAEDGESALLPDVSDVAGQDIGVATLQWDETAQENGVSQPPAGTGPNSDDSRGFGGLSGAGGFGGGVGLSDASADTAASAGEQFPAPAAPPGPLNSAQVEVAESSVAEKLVPQQRSPSNFYDTPSKTQSGDVLQSALDDTKSDGTGDDYIEGGLAGGGGGPQGSTELNLAVQEPASVAIGRFHRAINPQPTVDAAVEFDVPYLVKLEPGENQRGEIQQRLLVWAKQTARPSNPGQPSSLNQISNPSQANDTVPLAAATRAELKIAEEQVAAPAPENGRAPEIVAANVATESEAVVQQGLAESKYKLWSAAAEGASHWSWDTIDRYYEQLDQQELPELAQDAAQPAKDSDELDVVSDERKRALQIEQSSERLLREAGGAPGAAGGALDDITAAATGTATPRAELTVLWLTDAERTQLMTELRQAVPDLVVREIPPPERKAPLGAPAPAGPLGSPAAASSPAQPGRDAPLTTDPATAAFGATAELARAAPNVTGQPTSFEKSATEIRRPTFFFIDTGR